MFYWWLKKIIFSILEFISDKTQEDEFERRRSDRSEEHSEKDCDDDNEDMSDQDPEFQYSNKKKLAASCKKCVKCYICKKYDYLICLKICKAVTG